MAAIRHKDTKPELLLRRALFRRGWRYRVNYKITGNPDIVFLGDKVAVFVDGCFWHGCPECYRKPSTNVSFWEKKLKQNRQRDRAVTCKLEDQGWLVLRIWEHEILKQLPSVLGKIENQVGNRKKEPRQN